MSHTANIGTVLDLFPAPPADLQRPARFYIGVASRDHVRAGIEGGFFQLCHGKKSPLERLKAGDWLIYYSPRMRFGENEPCQAFTALGRVQEGESYACAVSPDFAPHRRDIRFFDSVDAPILPLVTHLSFIPDKKRWGYPFRRGFFAVCSADFATIARAMGHGMDL